MTALLCAGEDRLEASALDAPRPDGKPNYTVDTLHLLQEQNSDSGAAQALPELFLITGADAFLGVPKWRSPDELFRLAQWIVVSRPDTPFSRVDELALTPEQRLRVYLLDGVADPISATELRRRLAAREDCRGLLPAPVLEYVQAHHLYGRDPAQTASNADNGMR
jgi:nicotinate-nucleotide adenylyltransferase